MTANDTDDSAATTMASSPMVVMEFENLPEDDDFIHPNDNNDDMSLLSSSSSTTHFSLWSTASSLFAANDNNVSRADFHTLPKETRDILKTIQMINDNDDISFDSEAAEEILNHITHTLNSNSHYNNNHNDATDEIDNKYYRCNPPSLPPTNSNNANRN